MDEQYYFKLVNPSNDPSIPFYFLITPKSFWDTYNCLYDDDMPNEVMLAGNGFDRLQESTFEYNSDPHIGRGVLLSFGYIENNNM